MLFAVDVSVIDPSVLSVLEPITPIFQKVSVIVGGLFGVYLLLLVARIYYERKKVKLLKDIRYDLDQLNSHFGVCYSKYHHGAIRKAVNFFKRRVQHRLVKDQCSIHSFDDLGIIHKHKHKHKNRPKHTPIYKKINKQNVKTRSKK
jgi:hypothetical protein